MTDEGAARREYALLDNLRRLNRKERFYLLGRALGNPGFSLGETYRASLCDTLDLEPGSVPKDSLVAMDYHLDCLYAALVLSRSYEPLYQNTAQNLKGTQQDIDLLVAWQTGDAKHIVMIEAKGVMSFSNRQLKSKMSRLKAIFGDNGTAWPGVTPHFLIASPKESKHIITDGWPSWTTPGGRPRWLELPLPADLIWATRCDNGGLITRSGTHWKIQPDQ